MAFDFGGILGGLFGEETPAAKPGTTAVAKPAYNIAAGMPGAYSAIGGAVSPSIDATKQWTGTMSPYLTDLQKSNLNRWDPNYSKVQGGVSGQILDKLMNPFSKDDVTNVMKRTMAGQAGTGWGTSAGGINKNRFDMLGTMRQMENESVDRASNWLGQQQNALQAAGNPPGGLGGLTPGQMAQMGMNLSSAQGALEGGVQNAADMWAMAEAARQSRENKAGAGTLLNLFGTAAGGIMGLPGVSDAAGKTLLGLFGSGKPNSIPAIPVDQGSVGSGSGGFDFGGGGFGDPGYQTPDYQLPDYQMTLGGGGY